MMRRICSHGCSVRIFLTVLTMLLWSSVTAYGQSQSLGDIARENREKKEADEASGTTPKMITNATLPKDPNAGAAPNAAQTPPSTESSAASEKAAQQRLTEQRLADQRAAQQQAVQQRAAQQWKRRILVQEGTVANLRMRVDRLKASIHFMNSNAYGYYGGTAPTRYQAQQMEHLAQLQQQLAEQRKKLEDMQEAARHAGMHTTVYDP